MDRTVLGAIHLLHFEHSLIEVREPVGLMRENREMAEFSHRLFSFRILVSGIIAPLIVSIVALLNISKQAEARLGRTGNL
jgi:hypothetical protein